MHFFTLHGHCSLKSCSKSKESHVDFTFCSPDLIPHIRVGMLSQTQGGDLDHFAYGIDINEHSLSGKHQQYLIHLFVDKDLVRKTT